MVFREKTQDPGMRMTCSPDTDLLDVIAGVSGGPALRLLRSTLSSLIYVPAAAPDRVSF